jgi:hypothetical protein
MTLYAPHDTDLFGTDEAERAKAEAFALLDAADYKAETDDILRWIVTYAWERAEFSANDLRPHLADVHPPRIGRAFALAQQLGFIEFCGFVKSTDVGTHAKRIGLYRRCAS